MLNSPNLESCYNVWLFFDTETQLIQHAAVRAYALDGEDQSKLALLRALAQTDFLASPAMPIPSHYRLHDGTGNVVEGCIDVRDVDSSRLVLELIDAAEPMPVHMVMHDGMPQAVSLPAPESPLHVTTFVEMKPNGSLYAHAK